jgi:Uma2 family endonuclease
MATVSTPTGVYTFEDFCWIVPDGQKADLINGVIYIASPDYTDADALLGWLRAILSNYTRRKNLGRVFGSRVAFRLNDRNSPEPDIGFVTRERNKRIKHSHVEGPPDLAIEIVSPDSIERDYVKKRAQYESAGVREYWIVDQFTQKVIVLRLDSRDNFRAVRNQKGRLRSQVARGFWLETTWLWQRRLPDPFETAQLLLGNDRF